VTLEDIIEEVFGDLEDTKESERPTIERTSAGRVSARGDVRYDELLDFLDLEPDESEFTTESLAEVLMNSLGRTAKIGDTVDLPVGRLRVEQLAQRRITRVGVYLRSDVVSAQEEAPAKR
jgi:CBS domain containing-hemolysin-like protein